MRVLAQLLVVAGLLWENDVKATHVKPRNTLLTTGTSPADDGVWIDPDLEQDWLRRYANANDNLPPPRRYRLWIWLAQAGRCETDPAHYHRIFSDLRAWRLMSGRALAASQNDGATAAPVPFIPHARDGDKYFYQPPGSDGEWLKVHHRTRDWLRTRRDEFGIATQVLDPVMPFRLWHNFPDEPVVLLDDSGRQGAYSKPADRLHANGCFRDKFDALKHTNSHILAPTRFHATSVPVVLFSLAKLDCYMDILMPTMHNGLEGKFPDQFTEIRGNPVSWDEKRSVAVFRGQVSGINVTTAIEEGISFATNPRLRLMQIQDEWEAGRLNSSVPLDFGIVDYGDLATQGHKPRPRMTVTEQARCKYLVVVDGHSWPDRVKWSLLTGSLLFIATIYQEWILDQLVPYKHYVPVRADMSDLLDRLEWASTHDAEAREIAERGKRYAETRLRFKDMDCYNGLLFMEYQRQFFS